MTQCDYVYPLRDIRCENNGDKVLFFGNFNGNYCKLHKSYGEYRDRRYMNIGKCYVSNGSDIMRMDDDIHNSIKLKTVCGLLTPLDLVYWLSRNEVNCEDIGDNIIGCLRDNNLHMAVELLLDFRCLPELYQIKDSEVIKFISYRYFLINEVMINMSNKYGNGISDLILKIKYPSLLF